MTEIIGENKQQEGMEIKVPIEELEDLYCANCGWPFFTPLLAVKRVSPLQSPTGNEEVIPMQVGIQCSMCGSPGGNFINVEQAEKLMKENMKNGGEFDEQQPQGNKQKV